MLRLSITALCIVATLGACSYDTSLATPVDSVESGMSDETGETDVDDDLPPTWLRVQLAGTLSQGTTLLELTFKTFDVDNIELCSETLSDLQPREFADTDPDALPFADPDTPMLTWYEFTLPVTATSCTDRPGVLRLGIGPWDERLNPQATANGYPTTSLNGLYTVNTSNQLLIYGAAGTTEQFNEQASTQIEAPLADGAYALQPLFLLPIEEL